MKSFVTPISIILISISTLSGCGGFDTLSTTDAIILKYKSTGDLLIFSNETEFIHSPSIVPSAGRSDPQTYYIHLGDPRQKLDSLPMKPDSILSVKEDHDTYRVYRYERGRAPNLYYHDNKYIRYIDVFFDGQQKVKFIKFRWDNFY